MTPLPSYPSTLYCLPHQSEASVFGPLELERIKAACTMDPKYWSTIHAPGKVGEVDQRREKAGGA